MNRRGSPWALPGPAAFITRTCTDTYRERAVGLHSPVDADGLADALQQRFDEDGQLRSLRIRINAETSFCAAISDAIGVPRASPAALAAAPALSGVVVITTAIDGSADAEAALFARLLRRAGSDSAPRLLWLTTTGGGSPAACSLREVRGVFDPLDGLAYVADLPRASRPLQGRLVAAVAVETAAWDVTLMDRLTALPVEQAVRPDVCAAAWDDGRISRWRGTTASWNAGSLDDWGGEAAAHPCWLAANAPAALVKRVWRGQLAALLPWVEQQRVALIERFRRRLRPDLERSGGDVDLLDWGPLCVQVKAMDERIAAPLTHFRRLRNELAHGRPATWPEVAACLNSAPQLSSETHAIRERHQRF